MFVTSKKFRTLKPQKAKVNNVPYKTSKLKVFFDGVLKLNAIAILLLEVYAWPNVSPGTSSVAIASLVLEMFRCGGLPELALLVCNRTSCKTLLNKMSLGLS